MALCGEIAFGCPGAPPLYGVRGGPPGFGPMVPTGFPPLGLFCAHTGTANAIAAAIARPLNRYFILKPRCLLGLLLFRRHCPMPARHQTAARSTPSSRTGSRARS